MNKKRKIMKNINKYDINWAIEFLDIMGYKWDGKLCGEDFVRPTIDNFFDVSKVILNGEEKGLCLYNEEDFIHLTPSCIVYKIERGIFVTERNLTNEWESFLLLKLLNKPNKE